MTTLLELLLDTLLPGGEGFPAASDLELAEWLRGRSEFAGHLAAVLAALPEDFPACSATGRAAILRSIEAAHPEAFGQALVAAYSGYYIDPRVLAVIERLTGYTARPPQPDGHTLKPFDPTLLDTMRNRPRSYREV